MPEITPEDKLIFIFEDGSHFKFKHIERNEERKVRITVYGYEGTSNLYGYLSEADYEAYILGTDDDKMKRPALLETIEGFGFSGLYVPVMLRSYGFPYCDLNKLRGEPCFNQQSTTKEGEADKEPN